MSMFIPAMCRKLFDGMTLLIHYNLMLLVFILFILLLFLPNRMSLICNYIKTFC